MNKFCINHKIGDAVVVADKQVLLNRMKFMLETGHVGYVHNFEDFAGKTVHIRDIDSDGFYQIQEDLGKDYLGYSWEDACFADYNGVTSSESLPDTHERITALCDAMKGLLLYKNKHYGDSALHPAGIFYKGSAEDSICIRIDDKLKRIQNASGAPKCNDVLDFIGYGFLYLAKRMDTEDVLSAIEKEKD
jgi:hypothetical protein